MAITFPGGNTSSVNLPLFLAEAGYQVAVTPVGDDWFYWHAWCGGTRVNGGLAADEDAACGAGMSACYQDFNHPEIFRASSSG